MSNSRVVILADTHVGDRTNQLHPELLRAIQEEKPDQILHAGDICQPSVIEQLNQIAPTHAVQGNRDWFFGYKLPKEYFTEINGLRLVLAHGHINIWYWALNYLYIFLTMKLKKHTYFQGELAKRYPQADIIIYGHIHRPFSEKMNGQYFINPGAGYPEWRNHLIPRYAILTIAQDGSFMVDLKSIRLKDKDSV